MKQRTSEEHKSHPDRKPSRPRKDRRQRVCPELYQVVVECENESHQQTLFEELRRKGYACRLLML